MAAVTVRRFAHIVLVLGACGGGRAARPVTITHDPHSYARPERVAVTNLSLDLSVDFGSRTLTGTAALTLARADPQATEVVLDTSALTISSVAECSSHRALPFVLGPTHKLLGRSLTITLGSESCIKIAYKSSPDAGALLWVDPAGTSGKQHPMLFSQSQAILARSWIPLQDSPGVRFTYDATIHVPPGLWALMSAENPTAPSADGVYRFKMAQPIPSYLMALAVGDFAFRPIGPRSGVYAEPSVVEAAASEFAEVETMIAAAEKLYGPYRWGRYDMLVLPPSFPYGGMENPRLTFLTPTVITGDRQLVSLIAHELAHSWSGNLVTNATWNDFWLNEGFTTYVEHRLMEQLRGPDVANAMWATGVRDLEGVVGEMLAREGPKAPSSRLAQDAGPDDDPDDIGGDIAYEKGAVFLRQLELSCGRETFDAFMRQRFDRRAFQSATTAEFEAEAKADLLPKGCSMTGQELADWLHGPGLPRTMKPVSSPPIEKVTQAAVAFAASSSPEAAARVLPPGDAPTIEWVTFLKALPPTIAPERLIELDRQFSASWAHNPEILMHWFPVVIRAGGPDIDAGVEAFLMTIGRRRMVMPIYQAMVDAKDPRWRAFAASVFERAKPLYHPVTRGSVAALLATKR